MRFLLSHGADPNIEVDDGYTCLLSVIESEQVVSKAIVDALIGAGADLQYSGINGWTPLHMAAARGSTQIAEVLVKAGADVNRRKEIDGEETPLMEAAFAGQPAMVELLLSHGADPSLRDTMEGRTPLAIARDASKGPDPEVVRVFKEQQMDDDFIDMYVENAKKMAEQGNHQEVIRILKKYGRKWFRR